MNPQDQQTPAPTPGQDPNQPMPNQPVPEQQPVAPQPPVPENTAPNVAAAPESPVEQTAPQPASPTTPTATTPMPNDSAPPANQPATTTPPATAAQGPMPATTQPGQPGMAPAPAAGGGKLGNLLSGGLPKPVKMGLIALLALLILGGVAFGVMSLLGSGSVSLVEYSSERFNFKMQHPEDWDIRESDEDLEFVRTVRFQEPTDLEDDSEDSKYEAEILVDINEAQSEFSEVEADDFFNRIEENLKDGLGKQDDWEEGEEYGELRSSTELEIDGYRALRADVDIFNFEDDDGENGEGILVFIYVDKDTQVTLLYEGHESDNNFFNAFDDSVNSFDYDI